MGKEKPVRPPKRRRGLTPEVADRLVEGVRLGMPWMYAAKYAGVSRQILLEWRQRGAEEEDGPYRDLVDRFEEAEADFIAINMAHIRAAAEQGQWQAAAWTLERRIDDFRKPRDREEFVMREVRAAEAAASAVSAPVDPRAVLAELPASVLRELLAAKEAEEG